MKTLSLKILARSLATLFVSCGFILGCSQAKPVQPPVAEIGGQQSPVEIKVVREANDGRSLTVDLSVVAKAAWPANDIVIEMTGMRNGEEIAKSRASLGSGLMLTPGQEVPLTVSVQGETLSEYRLDCLWGTHPAEEASPGPNYDGMLRDLTVALESQECPGASCPSSYVVTGEIFNKSDHVLNRVVLNVDYEVLEHYEVKSDNSTPLAVSELEIPKLNLPPGASQKIRVVFDPLPAVELAVLRPRLQIKTAE